ncbi:hypothetical protein [Salinispora arenicola]|uniref:hypothetical protein n=1 Tax=Salinispora arenicola TaxID=168697 RepID=UPI00036DB0D0|nr:hypothetical protein [Salinispora arenicola]
MNVEQRLLRIRVWLWIVVAGLVLSGVTAFPLEVEVRWLLRVVNPLADHLPALVAWIERVHTGLVETAERHPFVLYGTDWLAFAHLVLAVAFWGPLRDPVRNVWVVQLGMIACIGIVPLALICGPLREIPWFWTVVDLSFAIAAFPPLWFAYRHIRAIEALHARPADQAHPSAPEPHVSPGA